MHTHTHTYNWPYTNWYHEPTKTCSERILTCVTKSYHKCNQVNKYDNSTTHVQVSSLKIYKATNYNKILFSSNLLRLLKVLSL